MNWSSNGSSSTPTKTCGVASLCIVNEKQWRIDSCSKMMLTAIIYEVSSQVVIWSFWGHCLGSSSSQCPRGYILAVIGGLRAQHEKQLYYCALVVREQQTRIQWKLTVVVLVPHDERCWWQWCSEVSADGKCLLTGQRQTLAMITLFISMVMDDILVTCGEILISRDDERLTAVGVWITLVEPVVVTRATTDARSLNSIGRAGGADKSYNFEPRECNNGSFFKLKWRWESLQAMWLKNAVLLLLIKKLWRIIRLLSKVQCFTLIHVVPDPSEHNIMSADDTTTNARTALSNQLVVIHRAYQSKRCLYFADVCGSSQNGLYRVLGFRSKTRFEALLVLCKVGKYNEQRK